MSKTGWLQSKLLNKSKVFKFLFSRYVLIYLNHNILLAGIVKSLVKVTVYLTFAYACQQENRHEQNQLIRRVIFLGSRKKTLAINLRMFLAIINLKTDFGR